MLPSRLGCPLSLKTPNMRNIGYNSRMLDNRLIRWFQHHASFLLASALVIIALVLAGVLVYTTSDRELTPLEGVLFQLVILGGGLTGSYLFGHIFANRTAGDQFRPYAKSAFRRVLNLYISLSELRGTVNDHFTNDESDCDTVLRVVLATVTEQVRTGYDTLEDWRDIIPDEINEVQKRASRPSGGYQEED